MKNALASMRRCRCDHRPAGRNRHRASGFVSIAVRSQTSMFDWITGFVVRSGYGGVLLLMLAENVVPPIPSELIMPLAGFTAARGQLSLVLVILAGTAGGPPRGPFLDLARGGPGPGRLKHLGGGGGGWGGPCP